MTRDAQGAPQYKNLVVLLEPDDDPKVFDGEGIDVTIHCQSITILPGRLSKALMLRIDSRGNHYVQHNSLATYVTNIANITGTWTAKPKTGE